MLIGYARVSTADQNLDLQKESLKNIGCQKIYEDKATGSNANRQGLKQAIDQLRDGDTFVVWKLDRLGRSVKGLIDFVANLESNNIQFRSLTDQIDTGSPAGRFFFHVMASLAQMERELVSERTRAGLDAARRRGKVGGRKRVMTESKVESARKLLSTGSCPKDVANNLGVSIPTLYRWVPASS
jgi:DNA invertase Pin-like site-specific DNA recombinase